MEMYNENNYDTNKGAPPITQLKSWVKSILGILITIIGVAVIFIVASLEGTRSVKASGATSAKLLAKWREDNNITDHSYPEAQADIIVYEDKEYYFVIEELNPETNEIVKWYFAYDGGLDYILNDYKFYVLTLLTIAISISVARINFISTVNKEKENERFKASQKYYSEEKTRIKQFTQYLPAFCSNKTRQAFADKKREIVESADIVYSDFLKEDFDKTKLEKWQRKKLRKIKKIKVQPLVAADLLQERNHVDANIRMLPASQEKLQNQYMAKNLVMKVISSALSGVVVGFGVVLGNWYLGLTYGFTILMSAINAVAVAKDLTDTTLRFRFIAKGDYLNEFFNIKEMFIEEERQKAVIPEPEIVVGEAEEEPIKDLIIKGFNNNVEPEKELNNPFHKHDLISID